MGAKYCVKYICLSVCSHNMQATRLNFFTFLYAWCLWPLLWYVISFGFMDDITFSYHGSSWQNQLDVKITTVIGWVR